MFFLRLEALELIALITQILAAKKISYSFAAAAYIVLFENVLMQKQLVFMITAAVLLAAFASVALYTVHIANAQSNMTSAGGAENMTTGSNMTRTAGNTTGGAHDSSIHTTNPAAYSTHDSGRSIRNVK